VRDGWDAVAAVGAAAVRVDGLTAGCGHPTGFRAPARRAYVHALRRAQRDRSRGRNHGADGFAALGDAEIAARLPAIGMGR
jgi:hypothetical protein